MRRVALDQPVNEAGTAYQADLADGERQGRALFTPVQRRLPRQHTAHAAHLVCELAHVEPSALEQGNSLLCIRQRITAQRDLVQRRQLIRRQRRQLQQPCHPRVFRARLAHAQHRDLPELPELLFTEAVRHQTVKVGGKKTAHVLGETVIGDDVGQHPAQHQVVIALAEEAFLAPRAAVHLQVRRVEEQQMERAARDAGEIVAAHRDVVQLFLRCLRAAVIQFCAVGHGVPDVPKLMEGLAFPAAGVQQVHRFAFWEHQSAADIRDMRRVCGIVPEADAVHLPSDHGCGHGLCPRIRQHRLDVSQPVRKRF